MSSPGCRPGSPPLSRAVSERQRRRLIPGVACAGNAAGRARRPVWTVPRAVGDTTGAPLLRPATMTSPSTDDRDLAALPIGMFDSGMGGLTVLHECLVTLPGENFAYVGDTARFPYGEKTREELELFAQQLTGFLETVSVKLVVVACYSATSAALPLLQERFSTPIVGVVMPGARAAVQTSRYRRIGVLATEATVASGAYVYQQACPGLVSFIEEGDVASQALADAVRGFTAPLKEKRPDVVIMGCTHYPLIAPMLQRFLGRDVTLVNPATEIALEVEGILQPQGLARADDRVGSYRFYATGDVEAFRTVGARFLQMPLTRVRKLSLDALGALVAP